MFAIAALINGVAGMGFGLVATSLVLVIAPDLLPGTVLITGTVLAGLITWRERQGFDFATVRWAIVGYIWGTAGAVLALTAISEESRRIAIAVAILSSLGFLRLVVAPRRVTARLQAIVGAVSGLLGTVAAVGGPPIAAVYGNRSGNQFRPTMGSFFAVTQLISIAWLSLAGNISPRSWATAMAMMPAIGLGFLVSGKARALVRTQAHVRRIVIAISLLTALGSMVRYSVLSLT